MKAAENCGTQFCELHEGVSHPPQGCEDRNSEQGHARTITENEKVNIKISVCPLSLHVILFIVFPLKLSSHFSFSVSLFSTANKSCSCE